MVDGPTQGAYLDFEFLFQFVEQVKGVTTLTVHLVDEDDDRRLSHAADSHQLTRLCLHTLRAIYHDNSRIDGSQRTEGILCKVLVAWCIEDIHLIFDI